MWRRLNILWLKYRFRKLAWEKSVFLANLRLSYTPVVIEMAYRVGIIDEIEFKLARKVLNFKQHCIRSGVPRKFLNDTEREANARYIALSGSIKAELGLQEA